MLEKKDVNCIFFRYLNMKKGGTLIMRLENNWPEASQKHFNQRIRAILYILTLR